MERIEVKINNALRITEDK